VQAQEIIDIDHDIPTSSPVCTYCMHLMLDGDRTCKAFPAGIPMAIWLGKNKHTKPFPNDQGIRFERARE